MERGWRYETTTLLYLRGCFRCDCRSQKAAASACGVVLNTRRRSPHPDHPRRRRAGPHGHRLTNGQRGKEVMTSNQHAVRWALRKNIIGEYDYTCWHWARNESWTACGRAIPIGRDIACFPETDDDPARVDCRLCRARKTFARVSSTQAERAPAQLEETRWDASGTCPRCLRQLNMLSPGVSIIAGHDAVCTSCLRPGETEIARAKGLF